MIPNEGRWQSAIDALVEYMTAMQPGDVIGYNQMSEICGSTVGSSSFPVRAALKKALAAGVSFNVIPTVGYRRNDSVSALNTGKKFVPFALRRLTKGKRHLNTINHVDLTSTDQTSLYATEAKIEAAAKALRKRKVVVPKRQNASGSVKDFLGGPQ